MSEEIDPSGRERFLKVVEEHQERYGSSRRDLMYMELAGEFSSEEVDEIISELLGEGTLLETELGELQRR
ncbi:MAG: hypothetical protein ACUVXA_12465 [Candidatus Jordarchaeum sp.]|uniref:hypothetical protein n=1 Tax=Candidatus Jordarchaeum sp. TaxID=2823881 RepID=UPI00404A650E